MFMLRSDGFWSYVEPQEVVTSLVEYPFDNEGAGHLVDMARTRGGSTGDNISLVLVRWNPGRGVASEGLMARLFALMTPESTGTVAINRLRHRIHSPLCR
jgi:serine/threonine protein phosphatase PrpC